MKRENDELRRRIDNMTYDRRTNGKPLGECTQPPEKPGHPFRTEKAKQAYLAFYDEIASRWPISSQTRLIDTSFGQTFVRIQGPPDGPPLALLPGHSESSLSWIPVIEMLSQKHRTFALDHVYDNGRSIYTREMRNPDDFVIWLDDLFSALGLNQLHLMAHSYGAWQASLYALAYPGRLQKLVLLAPTATILPPRLGLLVRAIIYYFLPLRLVTKRYHYWYAPNAIGKDQTRARIDEMIEEDLLARRCFKKRKFVSPTVLSDDDWRNLQVPTLILIGDGERTYSAQRAVHRLQDGAPRVKSKIAPDTDHHISLVSPKWTVDAVLDFLNN